MPRQGGASQQFRSKLSCVVACYLVKMAVHQGHVEGRSVTVLFSYNGCMHVQTAGLVFRRLCTLRHTCAPAQRMRVRECRLWQGAQPTNQHTLCQRQLANNTVMDCGTIDLSIDRHIRSKSRPETVCVFFFSCLQRFRYGISNTTTTTSVCGINNASLTPQLRPSSG